MKVAFLGLDNVLYSLPSSLNMWKAVASKLGPACEDEERRLTRDFYSGKYANYTEWMQATAVIHKQFGLSSFIFNELVYSIPVMSGAVELCNEFKKQDYVLAIVSSGFTALGERAKKELGIDVCHIAMQYLWNEEGTIADCKITPLDPPLIAEWMEEFLKKHNVSKNDALYIGRNKNEAKVVGTSVGFNFKKHAAVSSFSYCVEGNSLLPVMTCLKSARIF